MKKIPAEELSSRLVRLRTRLDAQCPDWSTAFVVSKVNQYYLTGTMQDGVLVIPRDGEAVFWIRRSEERAREESNFANLRTMRSFRDIAAEFQMAAGVVLFEKDVLTLAWHERFSKYFPAEKTAALDTHIAAVRAVKSPLELGYMEQAGEIHRKILEDYIPGILQEGMSEFDLGTELMRAMMAAGHIGLNRISMFDTDIFGGHICFGDSALVPNPFNGPGGVRGIGPFAPLFGSRERKLKRDDLVFLDVGCCVGGYHSDKTMIYSFGEQSAETLALHERCVEIQDAIAERLRPGEIPSAIHEDIISGLDPEFLRNFMGYEQQQMPFLGHGIGLYIDEYPVIAKKFDEPIEENMVFALEPKKGIAGVGLVGIENTFVVTPDGGRCITGSSRGMIRC